MAWTGLHPWLHEGYVAASWGSSDWRWKVRHAAGVLGLEYVSQRAFAFCAGRDPDSLTLLADFAMMIDAEAHQVVLQRHQAMLAEQARRAREAQRRRQRRRQRAAATLLLED